MLPFWMATMALQRSQVPPIPILCWALARQQCWCTPPHRHERRIPFIMEDATTSRSHHFVCWDLQSSTTELNHCQRNREGKKHKYRAIWERNGHGSFQTSQLQQLFCIENEAVLEGSPKMNRTDTEVWKRGHSVMLSDSHRMCQPAFI